jgi:hypothetical protein
MFVKLLETVSKSLFRNRSLNSLQAPDYGFTVEIFLFSHLKSIMKGACFPDVTAVQERVTAVFRSIPKEAFADSYMNVAKSVL